MLETLSAELVHSGGHQLKIFEYVANSNKYDRHIEITQMSVRAPSKDQPIFSVVSDWICRQYNFSHTVSWIGWKMSEVIGLTDNGHGIKSFGEFLPISSQI